MSTRMSHRRPAAADSAPSPVRRPSSIARVAASITLAALAAVLALPFI